MATSMEPTMGRVTVELELANYDDLVRVADGTIVASASRHVTVRGVVDTGAALLVIPEAVARQIGLKVTGHTNVSYADGRRARRDVVGPILVTCAGRSEVFSAIAEPSRETALIGAVVLETLDLIVDCKNGQLIPRDPESTLHEVELLS
jgi:predicted aspartyl protease